MAQSSITRTSMRLSRASRLRRLPSARAIARSRKINCHMVEQSGEPFLLPAPSLLLLAAPLNPWDMHSPLCVGRMLNGPLCRKLNTPVRNCREGVAKCPK